jgi:endonuclease/exonuclease/phosphatase family metal-dependent hydrolase
MTASGRRLPVPPCVSPPDAVAPGSPVALPAPVEHATAAAKRKFPIQVVITPRSYLERGVKSLVREALGGHPAVVERRDASGPDRFGILQRSTVVRIRAASPLPAGVVASLRALANTHGWRVRRFAPVPPPKPRLSILPRSPALLCWNARSLLAEAALEKLALVAVAAEEGRADVILLQETWRHQQCPPLRIGHHLVFEARGPKGHHVGGGLAVAVHPALSPREVARGHGFLAVQVRLLYLRITIVNVHLQEHLTPAFFSNLPSLLASPGVILAGDWNMSPAALRKRVARHGLSILESPGATRSRRAGDDPRSTIDLVVADAVAAALLGRVELDASLLVASDHVGVCVRVSDALPLLPPASSRPPQPNKERLSEESRRAAEVLVIPADADLEARDSQLASALSAAVSRAMPPRASSRRTGPWLLVPRNVYKRQQALAAMQRIRHRLPASVADSAISQKRAELRAAIKRLMSRRRARTLSRLRSAHAEHKPSAAWRCVNRLLHRGKARPTTRLELDGEVATTDAESAELARRFFADRFLAAAPSRFLQLDTDALARWAPVE